MTFTYNEILDYYSFKKPVITFVRHGENLVYYLEDEGEHYIIRIHKPLPGFSLDIHRRHYKADEYIDSEMNILSQLNNIKEISVQTPVKNNLNEYVSYLNNQTPVTVLKWIDGEALKLEDCTKKTAFDLGRQTAIMHQKTKNINIGKRYHFNTELIDEMKKELNVALDKKHINAYQLEVITNTLNVINNSLTSESFIPCFTHNDLGLSNIIYNQQTYSFIDFSFCGYGHPLMDVSSLCANFVDYTYKKEVVKGYQSVTNSEIDVTLLEQFFAFGLLLYITTQHEKMHKEPWFEPNMVRWENTIFKPVTNKENFILKTNS